MSIDTDKMIKLVMTVISNLLDKGWKFRIVDKFVDGTLILDDYGFCVLMGEKKIYVSPMYVIDLLVRSYYLEQDELEEGLLTDLIEQFILEFKHLINGGICNDYS